jgi:hypothetical protein
MKDVLGTMAEGWSVKELLLQDRKFPPTKPPLDLASLVKLGVFASDIGGTFTETPGKHFFSNTKLRHITVNKSLRACTKLTYYAKPTNALSLSYQNLQSLLSLDGNHATNI